MLINIDIHKLERFAQMIELEISSNKNLICFEEQGTLLNAEKLVFDFFLDGRCKNYFWHKTRSDGEYTYWIIKDIENLEFRLGNYGIEYRVFYFSLGFIGIALF